MKKPIFLCMHAVNQSNFGASQLLIFETMEQADAHIRDWLTRSCGLDCYCGELEAARLCAENGGELPELVFDCPSLQAPVDLEGYNGYHFYAMSGPIQLFLMVIHDEKSAAKFRREVTREYELDKIISDEADEMIVQLEILERAFREEIDYREAAAQVGDLLKNEGLPLF